ncbi:MAG: hypothetical protein ACXU97_04935 [Thermodesulfobacteriota bacterium]
MPDRGGSLKRLHRPNLLEFDWTGFMDKTRFQDPSGFQPYLPSTRPYEASEGIYCGHGQGKKPGQQRGAVACRTKEG